MGRAPASCRPFLLRSGWLFRGFASSALPAISEWIPLRVAGAERRARPEIEQGDFLPVRDFANDGYGNSGDHFRHAPRESLRHCEQQLVVFATVKGKLHRVEALPLQRREGTFARGILSAHTRKRRRHSLCKCAPDRWRGHPKCQSLKWQAFVPRAITGPALNAAPGTGVFRNVFLPALFYVLPLQDQA